MCWQDATKSMRKRDECAASMCTHKTGCPHCKLTELELQVKLWQQAHSIFLQTPHMLTADRSLQLIICLEEKKEPAVDSVTAEPVDSADEWVTLISSKLHHKLVRVIAHASPILMSESVRW